MNRFQFQRAPLQYGVSDRAVDNAGLSVEFKPPSHCKLHVNCDNPAAVQGLCQILGQRDMPFQSMRVGELPLITCETPSLAEVVRCRLTVSKPVLKARWFQRLNLT
jgi:hypothetical protein